MKQVGLMVVAGLVLALMASCGPKAQVGGPGDAGTEETGKAAAAPPAEAPAAQAQAPSAAENGPKVVVLDVGDERDEKAQAVTHQTREFTSGTPVIFVNIGVKGLTTGQKVKCAIQLIDGKTKSGEERRDEEFATAELAAPGPESHFNFKHEPPAAGWPVGKYELRVSSDGQVFETDDLTVK